MTKDDLTAHKAAIAANNAMLKAEEYDSTESVEIRSKLLTKQLIETDFSLPIKRRTVAESGVVHGNPGLPNCGYTTQSLPDPQTFSQDFPNSILKPGMKLLDFACGTGIISQLYLPYIGDGELVGMDINPDFLNKFEERAQNHDNMTSYNYDILDPDLTNEIDEKFANQFDAIVCTLSYHHIDNYENVTKRLVDFLKPQGWLIIVDFYNEDVEDVSRPSNPAVRHMGGLKIDNLQRIFTDIAHLKNVSAAREFKYQSWEEARFVNTHSPQSIIDAMNDGTLTHKLDANKKQVYLIEQSIIMAIGQK